MGVQQSTSGGSDTSRESRFVENSNRRRETISTLSYVVVFGAAGALYSGAQSRIRYPVVNLRVPEQPGDFDQDGSCYGAFARLRECKNVDQTVYGRLVDLMDALLRKEKLLFTSSGKKQWPSKIYGQAQSERVLVKGHLKTLYESIRYFPGSPEELDAFQEAFKEVKDLFDRHWNKVLPALQLKTNMDV